MLSFRTDMLMKKLRNNKLKMKLKTNLKESTNSDKEVKRKLVRKSQPSDCIKSIRNQNDIEKYVCILPEVVLRDQSNNFDHSVTSNLVVVVV